MTFVIMMLVSGCERQTGQSFGAEIDEADYRLGQRLVKQGRSQEALASYLRVIEKRGDAAPESHLEAGIICLQQIKDPIAAIYHFRKYLERQPNSPQASQVRGLVESAKREFARTLPANPMENQSERLDMIEQLGQLQRENEQLKAELAIIRGNAIQPSVNRMRVPTEPSTNPVGPLRAAQDVSPISMAPEVVPEIVSTPPEREPAQPVQTPPPVAGRRHVVAKGDTLFSLAQRYYNNRAKWRDIYEANRDLMPNENSLQIGMELRIP
ncbi:MAG: LysM peptidoglycan-binding domain-containing protein [Cephaloticoccus sp.]|nr:LysM peptidoglycan-binding domain-containing protein [Cephaloticoccus sp.]MCF7760589.1 LysM peptidoglycan-binding domain-containing protein [Cephaloticoccus sp.]